MKTTKEMIEVMQAYVDGAEIESITKNGVLPCEKTSNPSWDWDHNDYRVAKKTKLMKLEAWLVDGWLEWCSLDTITHPPTSWKRVPAEDKIIAVEED